MAGGEDTEAIDWNAIHRRMDAMAARTARGVVQDPEEVREILEARARLLASARNDGGSIEAVPILEFVLGTYVYGIEAEWVREVVPLRVIAPVPCTPPFIVGLMNIRGRLLSVTDLKILLNLPPQREDRAGVIILVSGTMELGITADQILGVTSRPLKEFQTHPSGGDEGYVKAVTTTDRMALLDVEALLRDRRLLVDEEVE